MRYSKSGEGLAYVADHRGVLGVDEKAAEIEERVTLKQSSMPEGLAGTLSQNELLDVIEF